MGNCSQVLPQVKSSYFPKSMVGIASQESERERCRCCLLPCILSLLPKTQVSGGRKLADTCPQAGGDEDLHQQNHRARGS